MRGPRREVSILSAPCGGSPAIVRRNRGRVPPAPPAGVPRPVSPVRDSRPAWPSVRPDRGSGSRPSRGPGRAGVGIPRWAHPNTGPVPTVSPTSTAEPSRSPSTRRPADRGPSAVGARGRPLASRSRVRGRATRTRPTRGRRPAGVRRESGGTSKWTERLLRTAIFRCEGGPSPPAEGRAMSGCGSGTEPFTRASSPAWSARIGSPPACPARPRCAGASPGSGPGNRRPRAG
jgi:hypothetical protein